MGDDDAGKKIGLVGAGLAGLLGIAAKMEHCVVAGGKAVAPAVHLAEDGARLGARAAPLAGEGAAFGAGVGRGAAAVGRTNVGKVAAGGRVFEGSGLRAVPLVAEDAARASGPKTAAALVDHGASAASVGGDLGGFGLDAATLVVDDRGSPGDGLPYVMVPVVSGRSALIALEPSAAEVNLATHTRLLLLRRPQIHGVKGLLSSFALFRRSSPVVIVGRGSDDRIRVPEGEPTSILAIASACASAAIVCHVVACPETAASGCERRAAEAWMSASLPLHDASREADVVGELGAFGTRLLAALGEDAETRDVSVAFVEYAGQGPVRVVHGKRWGPLARLPWHREHVFGMNGRPIG